MGDGYDGASVHQPAECLADRLLGLAVERGGCFVEQQQRGILEECPRDGDALPLAAGELDAALANERVRMPSGKSWMNSQRARECGFAHVFVGGIRFAVADILHDRAMEQRNVLRHDADGFP